MELIARNFESFPLDSPVHQLFEPLIASLHEVRFPVTVGERNSNQLTYDFDSHLKTAFISQGATLTEWDLPRSINQRFDFAFSFGGNEGACESDFRTARRDWCNFGFSAD